MEDQSWLEITLHRSARMGLDVLERASRRSVNWPSTASARDEGPPTAAAEKTSTELSVAFSSIVEFMKETTHQCQCFYQSEGCSELSDAEKMHVSRYHSRPGAGHVTSAPATKKHHVSAPIEDFCVEVLPGTYEVTATMLESQQQTQLVSVKAGESVKLTFNL